MLLQFRIKNYRSFRDETILDMTADGISEHNDTLFTFGRDKILPVTAVFGANACGKSNLISAYQVMAAIVQNSINWHDEVDEQGRTIVHQVLPEYYPFAFDLNTRNQDIEFEVWFITRYNERETVFNYGFKWNLNSITEEWLNKKSKTAAEFQNVFIREQDKLDFNSKDIPAEDRRFISEALSKQMLVVSLGSTLKYEILQTVYRFFLLSQVIHPKGDKYIKLPFLFKTDKQVQNAVLNYLQSFDDSITGFEIDESIHSHDEARGIRTLHKMMNSDTPAKIPLEEESSGTLRMFTLYQNLTDALKTGGTLWIDEMNAQLHPLLVRNFMLNFIDPKLNPKHAQLIVTSHDPWMLENGLLRRDEIWFVEKNKEGVSDLYSLADFRDEEGKKIRKDESYSKNYLLGKYGAVPELDYLIPLPEENYAA